MRGADADGRRQRRQQEVVEAVAEVVVQDRAILAAHLVLGAVGVVHVVRRVGEDHIHRLAIENPVGRIGTAIRPADQYIHPWMFGHNASKRTGLWLKNLPKLVPTNVVDGRHARVHLASPGPDRWKERSRTMTGIAEAMADQWGSLDQVAEAAE